MADAFFADGGLLMSRGGLGLRFKRLLRAIRCTMLLVPILLMLSAAGWLLFAESGLTSAARVLAWASADAVRIEGAHGRLIGPLTLARVNITTAGNRYTLHTIELHWAPLSLIEGLLDIHSLRIESVELSMADAATPIMPPKDLRLPLALRIAALDVGRVDIARQTDKATLPPQHPLVRDLHARFSSNREVHHFETLAMHLDAGTLTAEGMLAATAPFDLRATAHLVGSDAQALQATARVGGTLETTHIDLDIQGDDVSATGRTTLHPFSAQPFSELHLKARGLDPRAFIATAPRARLTLDIDLQQNTGQVLAGHLRADNIAPMPLDRDGLPFTRVDADLSLDLDSNPRHLRLDGLMLKLGTASSPDSRSHKTHVSGTATGYVNLLWPKEAAFPHGAAELQVRQFNPAALYSTLHSAQLDGHMMFAGDAGAQNGSLVLADGARRLEAVLARSGDTLTVSRLTLKQGQAELSGSGDVRLSAPRAWHLVGVLRHFDPAAFADLPSADLNATFSADGQLVPQLAGNGHFAFGTSSIAGQPLAGRGNLSFAGVERMNELIAANGKAYVRGMLDIFVGNSRLNVKGGWGRPTESLTLQFTSPDLAQHRVLLPDFSDLAGSLDLSATLSGFPARPEIVLDAHARKLALTGGIRLEQLDTAVRLHEDTLALTLTADNLRQHDKKLLKHLHVMADGSRMKNRIHASAVLPASRNIDLLATGTLLESPQDWRDSAWRGTLESLTLGGDLPLSLTTPTRLEASRRKVGLGATVLAIAEGRVDLDESLWTPERWSSRGHFSGIALRLHADSDKAVPSSARANGDWTLAGQATGAIVGTLRAHLPDLRGLGPAIDGNLTSAGALEIDAGLTGSLAVPRLSGHVRGSGLSIGFIDQNVHLQEGALAIRFEDTRVVLEQLAFVVPHDPPAQAVRTTGFAAQQEPGRVSMTGEFDVQQRHAHLNATLTRLPLSQRPERWLVVSGTAQLDHAAERLNLGAQLTADAGYIAEMVSSQPTLSDDIVVLGRVPKTRSGPRIESDITLDLGKRFHLRTSGLVARLAGHLRVRGNMGNGGDSPLSANGSIATQDATFDAYGQHLVVERGIVNFQGPLDDPGLNVLALRKGLAVEAGVAVTGTAQRPVVRLVSTPTVPDAEKLSWIVLGRASDAGGTDVSLLLNAAGSILGGQGEGLTTRLAQTFGVDELSMRQSQDGNTLSSQIFTIGKRLSSRTTLSYEQNLTAAAGALKFTYALTPRISLVTHAGENNAVDVFYNFVFD